MLNFALTETFIFQIMKQQIIAGMCAIAMLAACTPSTNNKPAENESTQEKSKGDITGQWTIESIVLDENTTVNPATETPGVNQYIIFAEDYYSIQTNCNSLSGSYSISGDSITLGDGAMTEMACENMATEDALRTILPNISTFAIENDTIVRLNGRNASEYILLHKSTEQPQQQEPA